MQNNQIVNDFLIKDLSSKSPRLNEEKLIINPHINPIIMNSQIEDNSRYTELSSI